MATHSSILAWQIPWTEEPGRLQSMGWKKESDMTERLNNNNSLPPRVMGRISGDDICDWNSL